MAKAKKPHEPGKLVKGPGTVRWHVEKVVKNAAAVVREKRDEKRSNGK